MPSMNRWHSSEPFVAGNKMEVRALRTQEPIFDMSGVRSYLDGEETG